jgi:hypothetical protein
MVFLPYPGRFIDKPGKSALCQIIEEDFLRVPRADGKSGKLVASRLRSPIDVLKIHLLQDLTIAYDNGVDIVRLEGVDFPTTGTKGLSALLPDIAGDGIVRTLCVVIALKVTIRLEGITIAVLLVDQLYIDHTWPSFYRRPSLVIYIAPTTSSRNSYITRWHRSWSQPRFSPPLSPSQLQRHSFAKAGTIIFLSM